MIVHMYDVAPIYQSSSVVTRQQRRFDSLPNDLASRESCQTNIVIKMGCLFSMLCKHNLSH